MYILLDVISGAAGGGFGPFPRSSTYSPRYAPEHSPLRDRDRRIDSDVSINLRQSPSTRNSASLNSSDAAVDLGGEYEDLLWTKENKEIDDYMYEMDPDVERLLDKWDRRSVRGWVNGGVLATIGVVLVGLFAG